MKPTRGTARGLPRDDPQSSDQAANDDPYYAAARPPEPTRCPSCGALFTAGRWTWNTAPEDAHELTCPACQRIGDGFPAGYVTLKGEFTGKLRDEIVALVTAQEQKQKAENPLRRVMAIAEVKGGLEVTTTDSYLARGIGEALYDAYKGDLKLRYSRDENLLRATWKK